MPEPTTRVTLFVPGTPTSTTAWNKALRGLRIEDDALRGAGLDQPVEVEWIERDGEFAAAFSFGTVGPDMLEAIDAAPGALVLRWPIDLRTGRHQILAAVERLRDAGAIGVRLEESKLGWDVTRWLELFSSDDAWAWHRGAVAFLTGDGAIQSCGMHAFSLPDVRVELDGGDPRALQELASLFDVYQLAEDPVIRSGQTFTPSRDSPRRVVERWPDTEYPSDHPCHNPYGVWRVGPPGGKARSLSELEPVFMPTLYALLSALEKRSGTPLTKDQVEAVRDKGACIVMEPRDAQKLERERGYADLDPALAWEQWEALRRRGS